MNSLFSLSAIEIANKIKSQQVSAVEVMQAFISRIEEINPLINAIHQFYPEKLLEQAAEADLAVQRGEKVGLLHGLPISVKDTCLVKGFQLTRGFLGWKDNPSASIDATVIKRLKDAGCIVLGITNVPEFLMAYETDNLIHGRTNNPYNLELVPGGSSGGEAALISAGGSVLGIGSDAGGSIGQPAHCCGICGHFPTVGFVSQAGMSDVNGMAGIVAQFLSMGPMGRYVDDLIVAMQIISGQDGIDPHLPPVTFKNPEQVELEKLRIGYFYANEKSEPTVETIEAVKQAVKLAETFTNSVQEIDNFILRDEYRLHCETIMMGGDGGFWLEKLIENFGNPKTSPLLQRILKKIEMVNFSTSEFRRRFMEIEIHRNAILALTKEFDVILSPVASTPARQHNTTVDHEYDFAYVRARNLLGWPATVVPAGYSTEGLPIGIQIMGKPWQDHICLRVAQELQKRIGVFPIPILPSPKNHNNTH